jgi:hypothetical protein
MRAAAAVVYRSGPAQLKKKKRFTGTNHSFSHMCGADRVGVYLLTPDLATFYSILISLSYVICFVDRF